jgi:hypothetical protein
MSGGWHNRRLYNREKRCRADGNLAGHRRDINEWPSLSTDFGEMRYSTRFRMP